MPGVQILAKCPAYKYWYQYRCVTLPCALTFSTSPCQATPLKVSSSPPQKQPDWPELSQPLPLPQARRRWQSALPATPMRPCSRSWMPAGGITIIRERSPCNGKKTPQKGYEPTTSSHTTPSTKCCALLSASSRHNRLHNHFHPITALPLPKLA